MTCHLISLPQFPRGQEAYVGFLICCLMSSWASRRQMPPAESTIKDYNSSADYKSVIVHVKFRHYSSAVRRSYPDSGFFDVERLYSPSIVKPELKIGCFGEPSV